MRNTLIALVLSLLPLTAVADDADGPMSQEPDTLDVGSCYSPQPICLGKSPVCVCDVAMNCHWACM